MKQEKDKEQNPFFPNDQIEVVADDYRNNETVLKEIEKNTELLNEIESIYNRQLDKILTKIIRVMNEIKRVDDGAIKENLEERQKKLWQKHSKWNQKYWRKKRNCEKIIYSLWSSIISKN
ncbi:hypothetical protein ES703_99910 [subsurface metagenome]